MSIRRMMISSDLPLAEPQGREPRSRATGSSVPANLGSRLASRGYSTCCTGLAVSNSSSGLRRSIASTPAPTLEGLAVVDEACGRDGAWVLATGSGLTVAGSPNPGGSRDSGRSWAIAGSASRAASAAVPAMICLVRRCIARHVSLDRLDRRLLDASGQQENATDEEKDDDNQEKQASRHGCSN